MKKVKYIITLIICSVVIWIGLGKACRMRNKDILEFQVLSANANNRMLKERLKIKPALVNARGSYGETALHWACLQGRFLLLTEFPVSEEAVNIIECDTNADYLSTIKLLIEYGADINATGKDGWTPLHLASAYGKSNIVEYLVKQGSDVNKKDNAGHTAFDRATENNNIEVVNYFKDKFLNICDIQTKGDKECIKYYDDNIVFVYPSDMKILRSDTKNKIYSLVRPPDPVFLLQIKVLNSVLEKAYERKIKSVTDIPSASGEYALCNDLHFGQNSGYGFWAISRNNKAEITKYYRLLLNNNQKHIGIEIYSSGEYELSDYSEILNSIEVK
jgi:hypothetical protein